MLLVSDLLLWFLYIMFESLFQDLKIFRQTIPRKHQEGKNYCMNNFIYLFTDLFGHSVMSVKLILMDMSSTESVVFPWISRCILLVVMQLRYTPNQHWKNFLLQMWYSWDNSWGWFENKIISLSFFQTTKHRIQVQDINGRPDQFRKDVWKWSDVSLNAFRDFHWYPELLWILTTNYEHALWRIHFVVNRY